MVIFLVIVACIGAVVGFFGLSEATMGVGFLAGACFLGIVARIIQASDQHSAAVKARQGNLVNTP